MTEEKDYSLKAAKKMQSKIAPMDIQMQARLNSMESILRLIEATNTKFIQMLTEGVLEINTPVFEKFHEEWGWLLNTKSASFGDYCYELYKKCGDKGFRYKISQWSYSKDNLDSVLKEIKFKFPERYSIIAEGFEYHKKKNYACSITLLLPHIEGILWDIGMRKKLVKKGYNSKRKYLTHITLKNREDWKLQELSQTLFPKDKFHKILVKEIFCEGPRNSVLHGRNIYNKKQREISRWRSTLLILTLWRLSDELHPDITI